MKTAQCTRAEEMRAAERDRKQDCGWERAWPASEKPSVRITTTAFPKE